MTFTPDKIEEFNHLVTAASKIIITAHKSPDGDSIGSSLALYHYLKNEHENVVICHPDKAPHFLNWLTGFDEIETYEESPEKIENHFIEADLIFCLDYNSPGRIGKMDDLLEKSSAKKIMIDHHRDPNVEFVDLMFSDHTICSTAQMIFELIEARQTLFQIDQAIAESIYTGIITDTGSFRFSSVTPKTHEIGAFLINKGLSHSKIHEAIFDNNSENRVKLTSFAMLEKLVVLKEFNVGYISLSANDLDRFDAKKGDTEGLVNQVLSLEGVKMAVFFKESDGIIKISMRSQGEIPVNNLARNNFHGGGHLNAAGGKFVGKLEDAIQKFVTILPKFVEENKSVF
ncbi:DHH family phosphoesterase [Crocinitomix algicola]|uniref:DHH family phosphoesterase n=1 Tax=Crocinitomix algicola TaxID=1740263 RepID=UPI0008725A79|nr:bifunctional oligoribonuclease/PAP phosphatase NrnA [Crocinitomix algicola]